MPNTSTKEIEELVDAQVSFEGQNFIDRSNYCKVINNDGHDFRIPGFILDSTSYNAGKVAEQCKVLKQQITYLDSCTFPIFIKQFDAYAFRKFDVTQPEFNAIVNAFIGKELKMRMAKTQTTHI